MDPAVHIKKMYALHSGQPDEARVIDFYHTHVLPAFGRPA
jgi:hypothetical protein